MATQNGNQNGTASANEKIATDPQDTNALTSDYCSYPNQPFDELFGTAIDTHGFETSQLERLKETLGNIRGIKQRALTGASNVTDASELYDIAGAQDLLSLLLELTETLEQLEYKVVSCLLENNSVAA
ncbi:MAG: hypothetical protein P8011_01580 [Acidihalobacter sp.]|uniref:hypothetical protein n=1 Tax=Acidihalobacter sp. TaxID=1872108 RepID=UPI00307D6D9E